MSLTEKIFEFKNNKKNRLKRVGKKFSFAVF